MRVAAFVLCMACANAAYPWKVPQQVHDRSEVAAAKASHLAAHSKAHNTASPSSWSPQERSLNDHDDGSYKDDGTWKRYDDGSYRGEHHNLYDNHHNNHQIVHHSSHQINHQSWSGDKSHGAPHGHWDSHEKKWTGPVALPPGYDKHGAPLPVQDTPEVAEEKSKFFRLYHHAAANAVSRPHY